MFKKKPTIKTLSPLRSSDRRKVADKIIKDYNLQAQPDTSAEDQQAASTQAHTALRNRILPDNALSATFTTTRGPELKQVKGTVYVGGHTSSEQRVLWINFEDNLIPSVYTLWHNPGILTLVQTPQLVVDKIKGGADLMAPGVGYIIGQHNVSEGSVVTVASLDAPSVPVAVGLCMFDLNKLHQGENAKGRAVDIIHFSGDHLWDWSTSGKPGSEAPTDIPEWLPSSQQDLEDGIAKTTIDDDDVDGGVSLSAPTQPSPQHQDEEEAVDSGQEQAPRSTKEIDDAFRQAFKYGVYDALQHNEGPKYGVRFPLSQSGFMQDMIQPYLPIYTPQDVKDLNIKKTSWKNLRKFIKQLGKEVLLLDKDHSSEVQVWDIDFDRQEFKNFRPYPLPKKTQAPTTTAAAAAVAAGASSIDGAVGQKLKVVQLYKPKSDLADVFKDVDSKAYYSGQEVKSLVTSYIETENLVEPNNKRLIKLNPFLANKVFSQSTPLDNQALSKGSVPRDHLIERVTTLCSPFYNILRNEEIAAASQGAGKPKSGNAPRIEIILETRSGNKTATRVHGFEAYHIQAQPLADELRKACAGSTSVEPFKGGKGLEVMVQGPQKDSVIKALEKRGIAKAWIDTTDKTKKK